ncbi:MAG TPA: aminotransferase class IV [Pyrinomonadaceae bacterium]|jgi:branched-subunit amino acid aminotransferase/4-amino-4-deoxychorismate lyase
MHPYIIHNERLLAATKARLPGVTWTTLDGRGVFTAPAVYNSRPFMWPEHWVRLAAHADRLGIDRSGFDAETVGASLRRLIEANKVEAGRARVMLLARAVGGVWKVKPSSPETATDLLMLTGDARAVPEGGLALTVSPFRTNTHSPLAGLKSINYLEHILSWEEARRRDFDEAVVLNERGEIVSTTTANLFWVKNGTLHTPALSTGAIAGTTRARLISLASELSFPLVEGVYDLSDLGDADEIFLSSSSFGVAITTTFDFHRYTVPAGSVALRLHEAFRQLTLQPD